MEEELNAEQTKTGEKYILSLPNCKKCNLITTEIIDKILKHLELYVTEKNNYLLLNINFQD